MLELALRQNYLLHFKFCFSFFLNRKLVEFFVESVRLFPESFHTTSQSFEVKLLAYTLPMIVLIKRGWINQWETISFNFKLLHNFLLLFLKSTETRMTFQMSTFFKRILYQYNLDISFLVVTNMYFVVFIIDLFIDFGHAFLPKMFLPPVDILDEPVA
jgi:hypothetical protein